MSIYEEFINFLQKEYKLPKPLKGQKIVKPENIISVPKKPWSAKNAVTKPVKPKPQGSILTGGPKLKLKKGGVGSGRKAGSGSKLLAPKTGSPIRTAITQYSKHRTPSLHQKVIEAFRNKESKKQKPYDPLAGMKNPLD